MLTVRSLADADELVESESSNKVEEAEVPRRMIRQAPRRAAFPLPVKF
jgi:hypothetical protein